MESYQNRKKAFIIKYVKLINANLLNDEVLKKSKMRNM